MTSETAKYLHIKAEIEQAYKRTIRTSSRRHKESRSYRLKTRYFWLAMIGPSILAVALALIGKFTNYSWLFTVSWVLLAISYFAVACSPFLGFFLYRQSIMKVFTAPFANLLEWNVKTPMEVDAYHLPQLKELSRDTLKLGALELKNERSGLEKRTYMVTGALDKVGIFPGSLALFIGLSTIVKTLGEFGIAASMDWLFAVAVTNVFFFILCFYVQVMLVHYDRMIALTELAIEQKTESIDSHKAVAIGARRGSECARRPLK